MPGICGIFRRLDLALHADTPEFQTKLNAILRPEFSQMEIRKCKNMRPGHCPIVDRSQTRVIVILNISLIRKKTSNS